MGHFENNEKYTKIFYILKLHLKQTKKLIKLENPHNSEKSIKKIKIKVSSTHLKGVKRKKFKNVYVTQVVGYYCIIFLLHYWYWYNLKFTLFLCYTVVGRIKNLKKSTFMWAKEKKKKKKIKKNPFLGGQKKKKKKKKKS